MFFLLLFHSPFSQVAFRGRAVGVSGALNLVTFDNFCLFLGGKSENSLSSTCAVLQFQNDEDSLGKIK